MSLDRRKILTGTAAFAGVCGLRSQLRAAGAEPPSSEWTLDAKPARLRLRPGGPETDGLGFGSDAGPPILRVAQGAEFALRLRNGLAEPTSIEWHGLRGVGATSGLQPLAVGPSAEAVIRVRPPDSGTYWFHPAASVANQTAKGLAGVLIVAEAEPPAFDQDQVVFLADWLLNADNRLAAAQRGDGPTPTTVITVNGRVAPAEWTFRPGSRLRLRIVNGSTRRVMLVACDGARPLILAIDGQPSELFEPIRDTVPIGPGARFDLAVDLPRDANQTVTLMLKGTERIEGQMEPDRPLAAIKTDGVPLDAKPAIQALPANPVLPRQIPLEASKRIELLLASAAPPGGADAVWTVNGVSGATLTASPVLKVKRGESVTLGFVNTSTVMVPLRIVGQAVRLLHAKDDGWEPYWRDSVLLPPASRHHVAFVADTPGRFAVGSAFDDQALAGLRCWFEVAAG